MGGEKRCIMSKKKVVETGVIETNTRFASRLHIQRTFPQPSIVASHSLAPLSHLLQLLSLLYRVTPSYTLYIEPKLPV